MYTCHKLLWNAIYSALCHPFFLQQYISNLAHQDRRGSRHGLKSPSFQHRQKCQLYYNSSGRNLHALCNTPDHLRVAVYIGYYDQRQSEYNPEVVRVETATRFAADLFLAHLGLLHFLRLLNDKCQSRSLSATNSFPLNKGTSAMWLTDQNNGSEFVLNKLLLRCGLCSVLADLPFVALNNPEGTLAGSAFDVQARYHPHD